MHPAFFMEMPTSKPAIQLYTLLEVTKQLTCMKPIVSTNVYTFKCVAIKKQL